MIDLILSILSPIWGYLAGGLALLFGGWLWKRKNAKIEELKSINLGLGKIIDIHNQDIKTDKETQVRIDELRKKVEDAETSEQGAEQVSGAINDYFGGQDK